LDRIPEPLGERSGGCELDLDDGRIYDASMDTTAISPAVHRQEIHDHLAACRPCAALLAYSRRFGDCAALASWRGLLATHLANEEEWRAVVMRDVSRAATAPLHPRPDSCCAVMP